MTIQKRVLHGGVAAAVAGALGLVSPAAAQAPVSVPMQGFLTDASGRPVSGPTELTLSFYDADTSATALFRETQSVEVNDGYFTVYVGEVESLDAAFFRDHSTLFAGVTVGAEAEMAPRLAVGTVPFAAYAAYAGEVPFDALTGVPAGLSDGDDVGPSYAAGAGLSLSGTTLAVDTAAIQARVSAACASGSSIRAIAADGTVACEVDDDTITAYAAGTGLALAGTTFSVDPSVTQSRVVGACLGGSSIRAIAADGTVTCELDDVGVSGSSYTAGAGLSLTGTTFSVDASAVQARVAGACLSGSSIRSIASDGTVTCEADDDTNTTYAAGTGLSLTGTTFAVDPSAIQTRVAGACLSGSSIRSIASDGTVTCEADDDTNTTYAAGTGLSLTGTTFAVDASSVQARVAGACLSGSSIRAIASDGTVTCEPDDDTNTTYSAGTGLSLTGTTFAVNPTVTQARVAGACASGSSIRAIASDGTVTCELDDVGSSGASYTAGTGLSLTGTTFSVDASAVQTRVAGACLSGSSIRSIASDGTVTCEPDDDTNTTYSAGTGLSLTGTTFAVNSSVTQARVAGVCGSGQAITGINADGSVVCTATGTLYAAGTGLALTGTTFSVDTAAIQRRVTGTCPGGAITAIGADGTVTCGSSSSACGAGTTLCGSVCVDTSSNDANCGGCGLACTSGLVCSAARCVGRFVNIAGYVFGTPGEGWCAVRSTGEVVCAGIGERYIGIPYPTTTVAGVTDASDVIFPGGDSFCVLHRSGSVSCAGTVLGDGTTGVRSTLGPVTGVTDAVALARGDGHVCALRASGRVACWGNNFHGQLGDGSTTTRYAPVQVTGLTDAVAIGAANGHTCAVRAGGSVVCWGYNSGGELGDGTTVNRTTPVTVVGVSGARGVAATNEASCAFTAAGDVYCWGREPTTGQNVGTGYLTAVRVPGIAAVVQLASGVEVGVCARSSAGTVSCWPGNDRGDGWTGAAANGPGDVVLNLTDAVDVDVGAGGVGFFVRSTGAIGRIKVVPELISTR